MNEVQNEVQLVSCWNHDDTVSVTVDPQGRPLCEQCAVALARKIHRAHRRLTRLAGAAPSLRTRP